MIVKNVTQILKNIACAKKIIFLIPATCSCKNGQYVGSIIEDSVVMYGETIQERKTVATKSTSTKAVLTKFTLTNFYILQAFLSITIALLTAVGTYCYLIKYQAELSLYYLATAPLEN